MASSNTAQFSVAVGPINDAPIILSIEDQVIDEDSVGCCFPSFR